MQAQFRGGEKAWRTFLEKNANASVASDNGAPNGQYTVIGQFIVNTDGTLSDIKVLTDEGYGMEQELLRLLQKSGPWYPAELNGVPVKAYRKQPLTFVVLEDGFDMNTKVPFTLFIGIENELTFDMGKIKPEEVKLTISEGTITPAGGNKYIVRVNQTGRVTIEIYIIKKNTKLGAMSFKVKPVE
jgi:hypothetical protein